MEWVEKSGTSVDEAKELALAHLGVSEVDAELVVLAEPRTGLFGRVRGEARVRARVRPAEPRPKRPRRQRERGQNDASAGPRSAKKAVGAGTNSKALSSSSSSSAHGGAKEESGNAEAVRANGTRRRRGGRGRGGRGGSGNTQRSDSGSGATRGLRGAGRVEGQDGDDKTAPRVGAAREESTVADGVTLQEQAEVARKFIEGLIGEYGLDAVVEVRELDEETVELAATGEGLGILVGPKGATIAALQDVTRTVVQRHFPNKTDRIIVDVAGYRERRAGALRRFTEQVAAQVLETGTEQALETMSPADRKVVHDAVAEIDGVASSSQGEDPNRYVVISPAS